jgi:transposase-like protein
MEGNNSGLGSAKKAARGSWTMAQKQQVVAESNMPGANVAEVAKRHCVFRARKATDSRHNSPQFHTMSVQSS